jgi:hypothetical protein
MALKPIVPNAGNASISAFAGCEFYFPTSALRNGIALPWANIPSIGINISTISAVVSYDAPSR